LGANIHNEEAIRKIFEAKGRPFDNPLIAHIYEISQLESITSEITPSASKLIEAFFPGPLTVILPKDEKVPDIATAGLKTIGVRMPSHAIARQFLRACGVAVVAPSANLSGKPSPTTWQDVKTDLGGRIGCILKSDQTKVGLESTVVDCTVDPPVVLRAGAVTLEQLREVIPDIELSYQGDNRPPRSPGMKYRHYAPAASVVINPFPQYTIPADNAAYIGLDSPPHPEAFKRILICNTVEEYARELFRFFRDCDAEAVETIYCQAVKEDGLGLALMDRIRRASHA
jgi:L-threonylcarbamoyladenylate synthase